MIRYGYFFVSQITEAYVDGVHYTITSVDQKKETAPGNFVLTQNYPNPFNPLTTIEYSIPYRTLVSLRLYNLMGQEVALLFEGNQEAGDHKVILYGKDLSSGIYFYRLETDNFTATRKCILVK